MGTVVIENILLTPLKRIEVKGGDVLHAMKSTDAGYHGFGEAYFSIIEKGAVKAWKKHQKMTLNLVVPHGEVRFVFFSPDLKFCRTENIGTNNYVRLTVPPGIWFGFQGIAFPYSLLLNVADMVHDTNEVSRKTIGEINFNWNLDI